MKIKMRHPDLGGGSVDVDARAFEKVWEPKGWIAESPVDTQEPETTNLVEVEEEEPSGASWPQDLDLSLPEQDNAEE